MWWQQYVLVHVWWQWNAHVLSILLQLESVMYHYLWEMLEAIPGMWVGRDVAVSQSRREHK